MPNLGAYNTGEGALLGLQLSGMGWVCWLVGYRGRGRDCAFGLTACEVSVGI